MDHRVLKALLVLLVAIVTVAVWVLVAYTAGALWGAV